MIRQREVGAVDGWPTGVELIELARSADVVMLPDRVADGNDGRVAAFREEAQGFRVDVRALGLTVDLWAPDGAEVAAYREDFAPIVLPFLLMVPLPIAINLVSNRIQRWLDEKGESQQQPTLIYRDVHVVDGSVRVREIQGPADAVVEALRTESAAELTPPPEDE